jgi:hypothetical protein
MADTGRDMDDLDAKAMGERRAALVVTERVMVERREDGEAMATLKLLKLKSYYSS